MICNECGHIDGINISPYHLFVNNIVGGSTTQEAQLLSQGTLMVCNSLVYSHNNYSMEISPHNLYNCSHSHGYVSVVLAHVLVKLPWQHGGFGSS